MKQYEIKSFSHHKTDFEKYAASVAYSKALKVEHRRLVKKLFDVIFKHIKSENAIFFGNSISTMRTKYERLHDYCNLLYNYKFSETEFEADIKVFNLKRQISDMVGANKFAKKKLKYCEKLLTENGIIYDYEEI